MTVSVPSSKPTVEPAPQPAPGSVQERPAAERFAPQVEIPRVKRPVGRPSKIRPQIGPATPPGASAEVPKEYKAPAPKVLAIALRGTFRTASVFLGPHWELSDKEALELAESWIPVLEHYKVDLGKGGIWVVALGSTAEVLTPRIIQTVMRRKNKVPPSAPEPEPGPVPVSKPPA